MACVPSGCKCRAIHFIIPLEVISDQCSAFNLIKEIEVMAAGMEVDFIFTGTTGTIHVNSQDYCDLQQEHSV